MNKVYIVTSGEYSSYHIEAVFEDIEKAKAYCAKECLKYDYISDEYRIEDYEFFDDNINATEKIFYLYYVYKNGKGVKFEACVTKIEAEKILKDNVDADNYILIDVEDEEKALKAYYDRKAMLKAREQGI